MGIIIPNHRALVIEFALQAAGDLRTVRGNGRGTGLYRDPLRHLADFQVNRNSADLGAFQDNIISDVRLKTGRFGGQPVNSRDKIRRLEVSRRIRNERPRRDVRLDISDRDPGTHHRGPSGIGNGSSNRGQL